MPIPVPFGGIRADRFQPEIHSVRRCRLQPTLPGVCGRCAPKLPRSVRQPSPKHPLSPLRGRCEIRVRENQANRYLCSICVRSKHDTCWQKGLKAAGDGDCSRTICQASLDSVCNTAHTHSLYLRETGRRASATVTVSGAMRVA